MQRRLFSWGLNRPVLEGLLLNGLVKGLRYVAKTLRDYLYISNQGFCYSLPQSPPEKNRGRTIFRESTLRPPPSSWADSTLKGSSTCFFILFDRALFEKWFSYILRNCFFVCSVVRESQLLLCRTSDHLQVGSRQPLRM